MNTNPYIALITFFLFIGIIVAFVKSKPWTNLFQGKEKKSRMIIEDILKQLFHVEYSGRKATLNAMAGALSISKTSLVQMIELMAQQKLITIIGETLELTETGRDYALKIIRVHRLWEKYLSESTGIDKSEWHDRAEKMEHRLSPDDADKLYRQLGNPRFDPHGDPIPLKSGEIFELEAILLSSLQKGDRARIIHIEDEPAAIYSQILNNKIHINQELTVTASDDDTIRFSSEGSEFVFTSIVASNIGVRVLSAAEISESMKVRLSSLAKDEKAVIAGLSSDCRGQSRRRLLDLGFIKGTEIKVEMQGPSGEPKAYLLRNTLIALRNDQADLILINKENTK